MASPISKGTDSGSPRFFLRFRALDVRFFLLVVHGLPHQQRHRQWVAKVFSQVQSLGCSLLSPERTWVRVVHQVDDLLLVALVDWCHRDVPDCSELAAVVDVLVLQAKEV